jgi:hypothetical protein
VWQHLDRQRVEVFCVAWAPWHEVLTYIDIVQSSRHTGLSAIARGADIHTMMTRTYKAADTLVTRGTDIHKKPWKHKSALLKHKSAFLEHTSAFLQRKIIFLKNQNKPKYTRITVLPQSKAST